MLVLAVWRAFHPGLERAPTALPLARAIAQAVAEDSAPVWPMPEEAAIVALWAVKESWLAPNAVGDHGQAFGYLQLHSAAGRGTELEQVRGWLALLREGARICPESPAAPLSGSCMGARALADRRVERATELLGAIR
jgi:hypothetical protein